MRIFLVRIGKVLSVLKKDGFLKGSKRVVKSFFSLFRKVKSGDILFVTVGVGDSALFRAHNVAEELELNGFRCSVTVQDNPFLASYADKFKIFVFHRVIFSSGVKKLIEKAKKLEKEIIFETDDLVFDAKYLIFMDYFKNMNVFEKKMYENGVGGEILKDPYVKVCTTTTKYLAEKLKEYPVRHASLASNASRSDADWQGDAGGGKKVFIVPNKLSKSDVEIAEEILKSKARKAEKSIKIGYFSGTISHNKDFASITDALMQVMEKYPQIELFLVGPLDIENKLNKFEERIKQLPYVPREKHFENISKVDINLAPLEIGNPFCEAKSELKFFEAGIVGVPTVASATQTFKEAISDGVDGFVASDIEEWFSKLERLILSPELRCAMGLKARQKALEQYSTQTAKNEEYYAYLRSKIN